MVRTAFTLLVMALLFSGCTTTPLNPVDVVVNPPESITISGGTNLPDRVVHINDADEVDRVVRLINRIRGAKRSQFNFEPGEIKCLTIELDQGSKSTELTMAIGRMVDPHVEHTLFYESEHNDELWDLMVAKLRSAK